MQTERQKIHVLHIPRWFPHRDDSMWGLFVKNHLLCLAGKCENSVLFLHFVEKQAAVFYMVNTIDDSYYNCTIYIRKATGGIGLLNNLINGFRYFTACWRGYKTIRLKRNKPDLVHVHILTRPAIFALLLKWFHGIPYLISEHWSRYFPEHNAFHGFFRKKITRFILKRSEMLLPVSASLYQAMEVHGLNHRHHFTLANAVDTDLFKPSETKPQNTVTRLIHISCFEDKSKNISGLLKAMQLLKAQNIPVTLDLVGDGIDRIEMEALATNLGLSQHEAIFHGTLQPKMLVKLLQQSDFLIQTSFYETFSTVVAESLACGIPVLSTPVGIFPEIFKPDLGLIIPGSSPDVIVNSIVLAISKKGSFDSSAMRNIAIERFSNESVGKALFEKYESIISASTK
ncbi:MAG: glycosyltransferase [Bacteroidales bacterium]|nr:glycosyltransferase [Bacteroidales bacterium]